MNVYRIAHAGLLIEGGGARCLMDPVLIDPFECAMNTFEPPARIDRVALGRACDLVVLSHEHGDHFCVESLAAIPRDRPIVYPAGCGLIEHALAVLGFADRHAVVPGQSLGFRHLELRFTPSNVNFPEMGVVFTAGGRRVWNCVDTELDEHAIAQVRQAVGRIDVMLATYQVLVEEELGCDGLGSEFPYRRYGARVHQVVTTAPRCVVPSSCGYRYTSQPWMNQRGFPIGEEEFLADIRAIAPAIEGRMLAPGDGLAVDGLVVHRAALSMVQQRPWEAGATAWRPDRGVPPLIDEDPFEHGANVLREETRALMDGELLDELASVRLRPWRERMAASGVVWELDVVYPGGVVEVRWIDLAAARLAWLPTPPRTPKLITSICASTLVGLRSGEVTPYRALFTRRVVVKLYAVVEEQIQRTGSVADEPIAQALYPTANRRNVDWQLAKLGVAAPVGVGAIRTLPRRR